MTFVRNKQQIVTVSFCIVDFHSIILCLIIEPYLFVVLFFHTCERGKSKKIIPNDNDNMTN